MTDVSPFCVTEEQVPQLVTTVLKVVKIRVEVVKNSHIE